MAELVLTIHVCMQTDKDLIARSPGGGSDTHAKSKGTKTKKGLSSQWSLYVSVCARVCVCVCVCVCVVGERGGGGCL